MNLETEIAPELWQAIRRSYESQAWSNAILDSIHYLSDVIRLRTGLQSDGVALAGQALGGKEPKLRLNRLESESEKSIQLGVEQLLRGLYQAIRNPRSHDRLADSQAEADALIVFVGYLLRTLGQARAAFSLDEYVNRIVERNFVPTERYAELLVAEIPARQRLQAALAVFRRKGEGDGLKLRYFFDAILRVLSERDAQDLFAAMSTELRDSRDEADLRLVLQILSPGYWTRLDETARLRSENRLLQDATAGRYQRLTDKCPAGALATWSRRMWPFFSLKAEFFRVMVDKLLSPNVESQDYVFKYFFGSVGGLAAEPGHALDRLFAERLSAGDQRFKDALTTARITNWRWSDDVSNALKSFQPAEIVADDEVPF